MCDVKCPYCGAEQEINHDGGYGHEEDVKHEQECVQCEKEFMFKTMVSYSYGVYCQDGDHEMEPAGDMHPGVYVCSKCDFFESRRKEIAK